MHSFLCLNHVDHWSWCLFAISQTLNSIPFVGDSSSHKMIASPVVTPRIVHSQANTELLSLLGLWRISDPLIAYEPPERV